MLSEAESLRSDGDKLVADLVPRNVAQQEFSCHKKIVRTKTETINTNNKKITEEIFKKWQKCKSFKDFSLPRRYGTNRILLFSNIVSGPQLPELSFLVHYSISSYYSLTRSNQYSALKFIFRF